MSAVIHLKQFWGTWTSKGWGSKLPSVRGGSVFKLNSGTSAYHTGPHGQEHKETARSATLSRQGAHCCYKTDTQKEIHWPWFHLFGNSKDSADANTWQFSVAKPFPVQSLIVHRPAGQASTANIRCLFYSSSPTLGGLKSTCALFIEEENGHVSWNSILFTGGPPHVGCLVPVFQYAWE